MTGDDMSELKPCPLCEGVAVIERLGTVRVSTIIICEDCGLKHESGETHDHGYFWNARPQQIEAQDE